MNSEEKREHKRSCACMISTRSTVTHSFKSVVLLAGLFRVQLISL